MNERCEGRVEVAPSRYSSFPVILPMCAVPVCVEPFGLLRDDLLVYLVTVPTCSLRVICS